MRPALIVLVGLLAISPRAAADPSAPAPTGDDAPAPTGDDAPAGTTYLHVKHGGHLTTEAGADLTLPPGYYVDEASWSRVDEEVRRLQVVEVRLTAENDSMRASLSGGGWKPPWWSLVTVALAGVAAGYEYARRH